jgi:hypothetical protein
MFGRMQEFSSVSASAYDAESLTTQLNEKSSDGWDVVAIVSAGTNIVAYLSRQADATAAAVDEMAAEATEATEDTPAEEAAAAVDEAAIEEPAGWGAAPESSEPAPQDPTPAAASMGAVATATAAEAEAPAEPEAAPEPQPVASSEPAVPAGWYADPSGRYELRYWDGSGWTEHVSRAGQQATDPPVA